MLKFITRFLIFLLLSCLIAAGLYGLVQRSPASALVGADRRGFAESGFSGSAPPNSAAGQNLPQRGFRGHDHFDGGASLDRGALGILRNLGLIALITLLVVGLQKLAALLPARRRVRVA
jgi:hypothetical protein